MKKSLLIASALLCAASAVAQDPTVGKDPNNYAKQTSGDVTFTLTNRWLYANTLNGWGGTQPNGDPKPTFSWTANNNGLRTATVYGEDILISDNTNGGFHKFGFANGEYKGFTKYTLEGVESLDIAYTNQIGVDDYGHVYLIGYVADIAKNPIVIRTLDVATGALTEVGKIDCAAETFNPGGSRTDYYQIIGDVTGKEAKAQLISALSGTGNKMVVRATLDQNGTEWVGAFEGYYTQEPSISDLIPTYPADQTGWGTAAVASMIKDEEYSGNLFYVDGFTTCPTLYDMEGQIAGSFADCVALAPMPGTNGVAEVSVAGKNFVIYSLNQYIAGKGAFCRINVACFGDGTEYSNLTNFWTVPAENGAIDGLGSQSDGGIRIHCLQTVKMTDENGKEGAYILNYKCRNGLGVYVLAQEGFNDPNGAVEGIEIDEESNAAPVYYNLNGIQVEKPANGLYIVKRGNKVTKEIL